MTNTQDGERRYRTNGFVDPPEPPFVDWCVNAEYGCVLRDDGQVECWGGVPAEFPDEYIGDFYSCDLIDGLVACSGERPEDLGDDYW